MNSHQIRGFYLGCFSHEGFLASIPTIVFVVHILLCLDRYYCHLARHCNFFSCFEAWANVQSHTDLGLNFRSATYLLDDFCRLFNFSVKMESIYFARLLWELNEVPCSSMAPDMKKTLSECQQIPMFCFYPLPNLIAFCILVLDYFPNYVCRNWRWKIYPLTPEICLGHWGREHCLKI